MIDQSKIVKFTVGYRFQWEEAQESYVLLYPEGMIQFNGSAAEILKRCDNDLSVTDVIVALQNEFPEAPDLSQDVVEFLNVALEKGWVELV